MVSYQAMNMSSATSQFAPTRTMAAMYEPFHEMSGWEETLRGDIIPGVDDKSEYTSSESAAPSGDNQPTQSVDDKVQRRLAQNREAARKSRLRKKAYVHQLETSRMKLTQLEMELQKARQQGLHSFGATRNIALCGTINPGIASFEFEYTHWVEEQQKKNLELRNALQSQVHDIDLQLLVESFLSHYSELFRMNADVAKADIFYLISGMWVTPIERFFLWLGGFRPSELMSVITPQIEPLTEQQVLNVCNLQLCCQQAEDALAQGMDKLQQALAQSMKLISAGGAGNFNTQMEKLDSLESFINQADHLREQTLQQMCRILTTRQAARGLLGFGEYFQRLRALSSIWAARSCENYD